MISLKITLCEFQFFVFASFCHHEPECLQPMRVKNDNIIQILQLKTKEIHYFLLFKVSLRKVFTSLFMQRILYADVAVRHYTTIAQLFVFFLLFFNKILFQDCIFKQFKDCQAALYGRIMQTLKNVFFKRVQNLISHHWLKLLT